MVRINPAAQPWSRPTSTVPFDRDPNFTNRDELDQLWSRRYDSASRVALVGLGGVGKSHLAIEYAYRIRDEGPGIWVFWVDASSTTLVEKWFRIIAERTHAPGWDKANANILEVVGHWLGTHGPWVLIIDNADDMDVVCHLWRSQYDQVGHDSRSLSDYLPRTANGSTLITSRNHEVAVQLTGSAKHIIELGPMDSDTAQVLLRKKLTVSAGVEDAKTLVQHMEEVMPLAIAQAAAFINQRAEAEELGETVLQTRRRVLGEEDPDTLSSIVNLASMLSHQGQHKRAEAMYSQALAVIQRVLGKEHPDVLTSMNNTAGVLSNQGRYQEAEGIYRHTLSVIEKVLGPEHPNVLTSMSNIAGALSHQDKYQEAEKIYQDALAVMGKVLGPEHPNVLATMNNVAGVLSNQGRYQEAEDIYRHTLAVMERVLGKEDRSTLISIMGLGDVLLSQGEYIESEKLLLYAVTQQAKMLNAESPGIQRCLDSLTSILVNSSKFQTGTIDADKLSGNYDAVLQMAALHGSEELVRQLVQKRIKIDFAKMEYREALQTAADHGHIVVVRLLLENGANTNSEETLGYALQAASASGHEGVVRLLLKSGAKINAKLGHYGSALHAACIDGHQDVVQMLLEMGAYPNNSALQVASYSGHESVVRLLLESGADVNAKLGHYGSVLENKLPEAIFTILTFEVLLDPDLKDLCKKMLEIKGKSLFRRIFKCKIREFCSVLSRENRTDVQKGTIWILRRFSAYFAFRVCEVLKPSTSREGEQLEDLVEQTVEAGVETYSQNLHHAVQPQQDAAAVEATDGIRLGKTAGSDYRNAEDYTRNESQGNILASDEHMDDQSSASDTSDDEPDSIPQSLTDDTILWLTRGVAFRNFKHNIVKQICSPLQYIHHVLQPILPASGLCSATFHVQWELIQYVKSELEEGDTFVNVLTVSGGIINAEASSCLDYCRRNWPATGEFMVMALEKAFRTGRHEESSSLGTTIFCQLWTSDVSQSKERATIVVEGSREDVIGIAQQLAWLSTAFRVPSEGKFACSKFVFNETKDSGVFDLKLLQLQDIRATSQACWHPLFLNGVLAYGFPIRPRDEEYGVEIPFEAMIYFAGIIGPMEYKGGLVLKGFSTIIFPKHLPRMVNSEAKSVQWHLLYDQKPTPISLALLADERSRALWPLTDLNILAQRRAFLGCYREVSIHLGTKDGAYNDIGFSQANPASRRPVLSGFTLGFTLPKFGGPSVTVTFTKPKRLSLTREERSYEEILSHSSSMPLILYDTSGRRAWMVPALGVILHMIHIWAFLHKDSFPTPLSELPYANAAWDIGREAQKVIYENSSHRLYDSKDNDKPYTLKDLVKKYWIELENVIVAEKDHESSGDYLIGWDLIELVTRDPYSTAKKPATSAFKGNWKGLASDPNMVVLLCSGLGEVIVPNKVTQKLCKIWESVPTDQDYLTASVKCITQLSKHSQEPGSCSKLGCTLFWQISHENTSFADCTHDDRSPCHRTQELVKNCRRPQSATSLEQQGAIIFGHQQKKLQKRPH
ncbi:MAG: hypothetical protein Q9187_005387 [Circinaria calcarea]